MEQEFQKSMKVQSVPIKMVLRKRYFFFFVCECLVVFVHFFRAENNQLKDIKFDYIPGSGRF